MSKKEIPVEMQGIIDKFKIPGSVLQENKEVEEVQKGSKMITDYGRKVVEKSVKESNQ